MRDWRGLIGDRWEEIYRIRVVGRSILFGSVASTHQSFTVFPSSSPSKSPSTLPCDPSLWDTSPDSLYGIQTFPSGLSLLPPSLRSSPLTIITKALSPCPSIGLSKDILAPFTFEWAFLDPIPEGLMGVDINDWADGGVLVVPSSILENRGAFPMNEPVFIGVSLSFLFFIFYFLFFIFYFLFFIFYFLCFMFYFYFFIFYFLFFIFYF